MAFAVGPGVTTTLVDEVPSQEEVTVRNDGPDPATVSKDPTVVVGAADGWVLANGDKQDVTLMPGESLYAVVGAGHAASIEVV